MKKKTFIIIKRKIWNFKKPNFTLLKIGVCNFLCFFYGSVAYGQSKMEQNSMGNRAADGSTLIRQNYLPASATASAFEVYGQASVNKFTGSASINIPLFDVGYKDLSVSSSLSYQKGGGINPSDFPGIVGNGWMLNVGGVITRKSKGLSPPTFSNNIPIPVDNDLTNEANWSSSSKMLLNIQGPNLPISLDGTYDEFAFNFNGFSGMFYKGADGRIRVKSSQGEELSIEMIILDDINKEIIVPLEEQESSRPFGAPWVSNHYNNGKILLRNNPYLFVVTDNKGIKYTFGGTNESIEFSRTGNSISNFPSAAPGDNILPISWYLTSIKSPNGYEVNYVYERGKFYLTSNADCLNSIKYFTPDATLTPVNEGLPTATLINSSLINPCYLKKIITPEASVQFYWSLADKQLGYQFRTSASALIVDSNPGWEPNYTFCNIYFNGYDDVTNAKNIYNRFPNKLDFFTISGPSGVLKTVSFNYTEDVLTRLKLKSFQIKGTSNNNGNPQMYSFEYNPLSLPAYLSSKTDSYGFYNGKNSFINAINPNEIRQNFTNSVWRQEYLNLRAVDSNYTQAEILNKIIYPTGGYTVYEYENNRYGSVAKSWPPAIVENSNSEEVLIAGLRIKKITSYDNGNGISSQKQYFYKKNYAGGGQASSGVLSYIPIFYEEYNGSIDPPYFISKNPNPQGKKYYSGKLLYEAYSTSPLNPINYTKSGFINYSEVSEVDLDGGHVDTEFKNHDNGYLDRPALYALYDHKQISNLWKEDAESSLDLERGQVLKETIYDKLNHKKQKTEYFYNDDPTRFDDNLINQRILKCYPNPLMGSMYGISIRYLATLAFNYYPYLKEKKTTSFFENENSIVNTVKYKYNVSKLLTEQITADSKGEVLKNVIKYAGDYLETTSSDPISLGIQKLKNINFISMPVEQSVFRSVINGTQDKLVSSYFTTFRADAPLAFQQYGIEENVAPGAFVPSSIIAGTITKDSRYKLQGQIDKYDVAGNVLQRTRVNGTPEVYLWGTNKNYLIAEIKNATYDEVSVADIEFLTLSNYGKLIPSGNFKYSTDETAPMGNLALDLQNQSGSINTSGLNLKADKSYILSYWEKGAELTPGSQISQINIISNKVVKQAGSWTKRELIFDHITGELKFTYNNYGLIQDLKIYPLEALITSYSHKALVGMTTSTDSKGQTTYYKYDDFLRLKHIKDQNKDIVKDYSYNYRAGIVGNQAISGVFTKADCPTGYYGEHVEFSIPQNKYYGQNQEVANSLASNELSSKGQENANAKGTCFPNGVYVSLCAGNSRTETRGNYTYTYVNYTINVFFDHYGSIPNNLPVSVSYLHNNATRYKSITSSVNLGEFERFKRYVGPRPPGGTVGVILETAAPVIVDSQGYVKLENSLGCGPSGIGPSENFGKIEAIRFENLDNLVSYTQFPDPLFVEFGSIYSQPSYFKELDPSQVFYSDEDASMPAIDGYYTLLETHPTEDRGFKYYHIVDGMLTGIGWGGN